MAGSVGSVATILTGEWPLTTDKVGARMGQLVKLGHVRHDNLVEKGKVGKIIGARGGTLQALEANTQCEIFVLDKEGPPPGYGVDQRLIVLMGNDMQVTSAMAEVEQCLNVPGYSQTRPSNHEMMRQYQGQTGAWGPPPLQQQWQQP